MGGGGVESDCIEKQEKQHFYCELPTFEHLDNGNVEEAKVFCSHFPPYKRFMLALSRFKKGNIEISWYSICTFFILLHT